MLESVLQTICEYNMLVRGERVVCAVSGGADSVAMLCALYHLSEKLGVTVFAAHLNHGLRGEESDRDERFVKKLCEKMDVPLYFEKAEIPKGGSLEERAREERYRFYERACIYFNAHKIATAHHAEDNLETLLFHLARGTALKGLCGIPPVRGNIIRPLLFTPRAKVLAYLKSIGQVWVEDSSNQSDEYTRNLIRHRIIPVLCEINSDAVANSARCIKTLIRDEDALNKIALEEMAGNQGENWISTSLADLPDAILSRVIKIKCKKIVKNKKEVLDFQHICDIINLMRREETTGSVTISDDFCAHRAQGRIYFAENAKKLQERILKSGESVCVSGFKITCHAGEITIRSRRDGDKIKLASRRTRLVKKIFCDAKIPKFLRDSIPIIEKEGEVIAVCGFGFADGHDNGGVTIEIDA